LVLGVVKRSQLPGFGRESEAGSPKSETELLLSAVSADSAVNEKCKTKPIRLTSEILPGLENTAGAGAGPVAWQKKMARLQ